MTATQQPLRTLVTGAANGIGRAIAAHLSARGDTVLGIDREPREASGPEILIADLADSVERARVCAEAEMRLGGIDVLVNVAGIFRQGSIHNSDLTEWRAVWAVNLDAPLELMRLISPGMVNRGFGRILNVTSVHARSAQPGCLAYDVAKAGLEAATRSAALDLAKFGILANAVAPGYVRTNMSLLPDGTDETDTELFHSQYIDSGRLPVGRGSLPAEIAPAVAFLTDRSNTYVTGQSLAVDGGLTMTF